MSKQREAMQFALEAMEDHAKQYPHMQKGYTLDAIEALREALAEPEPEQKPVAWMYHGILHNGTPHDRPSLILRPEYMDAMSAKMGAKATPLYTAPPQRKPLTDVEIDQRYYVSTGQMLREQDKRLAMLFARAIERAHGIGD